MKKILIVEDDIVKDVKNFIHNSIYITKEKIIFLPKNGKKCKYKKCLFIGTFLHVIHN